MATLGAMSSNAQMEMLVKTGTVVLTLGTATVAWDGLAADHKIFLTPQESGTLNGSVRVTSRTNGTGFTITSTNLLDNATVGYLIAT